MKKVDFSGRRPTESRPAHPDDWILGRDSRTNQPAKRLTVNVPLDLHRRIKLQCAEQGLVIADAVRELLERRFPASPSNEQRAEQEAGPHDQT